jgi:THO complex subunit 1
MAVTSAKELSAVAGISAKLRIILQQAAVSKPQNTIEPPLHVDEFLGPVASLHDDLPQESDQIHRFSLVETATRDIFYELIRTIDIDDDEFVAVWNLLDIILICGDHGICTPELVCWLLEELLDSQTTYGCRKVFDYLELRRERLAHKDFHKKNLVFLRSCNELLRRLSRAEDAIFCGRVFFFLFQTFPLGDKSSVNLRGEFHTDNTTTFDEGGVTTAQDGDDAMEVDAEPDKTSQGQEGGSASETSKSGSKSANAKDSGSKRDEPILSDHELYPIFWRLQHDFSNPTRLYESANFSAFKRGLSDTIAKFKKSPTVAQAKVRDNDRHGAKQSPGDTASMDQAGDDLIDNYNPKYLTSRDLFHLELSDLAFQRHILVQALILIDFLLSLTEMAKKKRDALNLQNKSLLYAYTLNEDDAKWATSTRVTITTYLGSTRDGREYCRMIETVLARDKNWIRWKMESCPSIVRPPVPTDLELAARKGVQDAARPRRVPDGSGGGLNLSFLDEEKAGDIESLSLHTRHQPPTIQELVEGIKMDQLDAEMADDDELKRYETSIANKRWRALRTARAIDLALLDRVDSTKEIDLEAAIRPKEQQRDSSSADHNMDEVGPDVAVAEIRPTDHTVVGQ